MIEKAYLAANTPNGFINNFKGALNGKYVYSIKGGSGVGKSTLMKSLLKNVSAAERVTAAPCSSDPHSLDAVIMHDRGIAMTDGTAPHLYEPSAYGADGEIIDLGKYVNKSKLAPFSDEIIANTRRKSVLYGAMYAHLRSAKNALDAINSIYGGVYDKEISETAQEIADTFLSGADQADYREKSFGEYFTEDGYVFDREIIGSRVSVGVKAESEYFAYKCLKLIAERLDAEGMKYEEYLSAEYPDLPIAVGLKSVVISAGGEPADYEYSLDGGKSQTDKTFAVCLLEERSTYSAEIARAGEYFLGARNCHAAIEARYYSAMQFHKMEKEREKILERIFG